MPNRYSDPWITESMRHAALLADGDRELYEAYTAAQEAFLTEARAAVLPDGLTAAADPGHRIRQWPDRSRWVELLVEHVLPALKSWYTRVFRRNKHADGEPPARVWADVEAEYRDAFIRDTWADQLQQEAEAEIADSAAHDDPPSIVRGRLSRLLSPDAPIRSLRDRITARLRQGASPDEVDVQDSERTHRNQARMRARHSTVGAANRATLDVAEQSPETLYKAYLATSDERVRNTHWAAHKQSVPLHETFTVGAAQLRYPGDPTGPPEEVANCRCTLLLLDRDEHEQSNKEREMELPHRTDTSGNPIVAAAVASDTGDKPNGYWRAELAPLEKRGDYRIIGTPPNGEVRMSSQPWLLHQPHTDDKHNKSYIVGRIDRAWIDNSVLMAEGTLDMDDPNAREVHRKLAEGYLGTVSVDLEDATAEERYYNADGEHVTDFSQHNPDELRKMLYFTDWRLGGATLVPHPAFHEARVMVNTDNGGSGDTSEQDTTTAAAEAVDAESGCVECGDDETPGEPNTGGKSTGHAPVATIPTGRARARRREHITADGQTWADRVAATVRNTPEPPADAFTNPNLSGPTKVTVTDDGRVYGHVACWETSHISFPGRDVKPPRSETNYAMFHRHPVRCSNGERVRAGVLVMGTSHADLNMSTSAASSHYDHTGNVVADVRAGEDDHGIWVAGYLHPEVSPLQINVLDRYSLSGDWRGGELVAALVVNTPGFPIPNNIAASGELCPDAPTTRVRTDGHGDQYALVAAGIVEPDHDDQVDLTDVVSEMRQMRSELSDLRALRDELRNELHSVLTRPAEQPETRTAHGSTEAERVARDALARIYAPRFEALAAAAGTDTRPKRTGKGEVLRSRRDGRTGKSPRKPPKMRQVAKKAEQRRSAQEQAEADEAERQRQHELDVLDRQQQHEAQQAEQQREHESNENAAQRSHEASENERAEEYETERTKVQTEADEQQQKEQQGKGGSTSSGATSEEATSKKSGSSSGGTGGDDSSATSETNTEEGETSGSKNDTGDDDSQPGRDDGPDEDMLKETEQVEPEQRDLDKIPEDNDDELAKMLSVAGLLGSEEEARTFLAELDEPDSLDVDDTKHTASGRSEFNWVDDTGGLPRYVKRIAKHLRKKGKSKSHAIAIAIGVVKKMCSTGDTNWPGKQEVNAGSRAQACKAVAKWNAMKAKTKS